MRSSWGLQENFRLTTIAVSAWRRQIYLTKIKIQNLKFSWRTTDSVGSVEAITIFMKRKIYDVEKTGDSWSVVGRDNQRASAVTSTKDEAVSRAAQLGNNNGYAQVVIRKADGTIQSERTYGKDPNPPKG